MKRKFLLPLALCLSIVSLTSCDPTSQSGTTSETPQELKAIAETKVVTYDGPKILESSSLAKVFVNGTECFVYETRVNHKREFSWENDYLKNAVSYFDFEGEVTVTVELPVMVKSAKISPLSYGIVPKISGNRITFTLNQPNNYVIQYNDDVDNAVHLFANPLEQDIPDKNDPDVVYIEPGLYDAGAIPLESGQTLYLSGGAYVYGYIRTELLDDITIRGRGILCGESYTRSGEGDVTVPIELRKGKNITIEGISLLDPAGWATTVYGCENVTFDNVKIISARPNGDGISLQGSKNVTVKNGFVRSWDDSLVVKDNDLLNTENIVFDNMTIWTDLAQSMEIGFETHGDYIRNVTFRNITVIEGMHKPTMSIHNADTADITNILYENITLEDGQMLGDNRDDGENDFFIDLSIEYSQEWSKSEDLGNIDGVTFRNINVLEAKDTIQSRIRGYQGNGAMVNNVTFDSVTYKGVDVAKDDDLHLVRGNNVGTVTYKKGTASGAPAAKLYDLSALDKTKIDIQTVPSIEQSAILVPEFAAMKGDLSYLGEPISYTVASTSVTHGAGSLFNTPEDDGSGSYDSTDAPVEHLFDDDRSTQFESKSYLNQSDEFIAVTIDFNEELYVGNVRLLGPEDNVASYKYYIEVRYKKMNKDGEYVNFTPCYNKEAVTVSPSNGNCIDIAFSPTTIKGLQLRIYRYDDAHFDIGGIRLSEMVLYGPSLSYKKPIVDATGYADVYPATKVTDGDPNGTSYYESDSLPAYIVIDLKDVYQVQVISLHLPALLTWTKRTQEIELLASDSNAEYDSQTTTFTTCFEKQKVTFDPTTGNKKLIEFDTPVSMRYLKIVISSNDIAAGYYAQLSEVYVFGSK